MAKSSPSPEPDRGEYREWQVNVGSMSSSEKMRVKRERFYSDRANLMFRQLLKNPPAGVNIENYADYAVANPDHADFGLKTFQQLKEDNEHFVIAEKVPVGKTLSDYLYYYFKIVYGGKATRQQIWKEVWLSVYYMASNEFEYDKDDNVVPLNVDQVITGNKVIIQNGRLTVLRKIRGADGTTSYISRIRGVPLRPGTGWRRPPKNERHTTDIIKDPGEEAARQLQALRALQSTTPPAVTSPRVDTRPAATGSARASRPEARPVASSVRPAPRPSPSAPEPRQVPEPTPSVPAESSVPPPSPYVAPARQEPLPAPRRARPARAQRPAPARAQAPAPAPAPRPSQPQQSPVSGTHEDMPRERPPTRENVAPPRSPVIPPETPEQQRLRELSVACANANGAIDSAQRAMHGIDDTRLNGSQRDNFNQAHNALVQARSKYSAADQVRRTLPSDIRLTQTNRTAIASALTDAQEAMRLANEARDKVQGFPARPQVRRINLINQEENRVETTIRRRFAIPQQVILGIDDRGNYWVTESRLPTFPVGIRIGGPFSPAERPALPDPVREQRERAQTTIETEIADFWRKYRAVEIWLRDNPHVSRDLFNTAHTHFQTGLRERNNGNLSRAEGNIQIANSFLDTFIETNHITVQPSQ